MTYCCGFCARRPRHDRRHAHQCRPRQSRPSASFTSFGVPGQRIMALASSGNLSVSQSVVFDADRGHRESGDQASSRPCSSADDVSGGAAHRPWGSASARARRRGATGRRRQFDVSFLFGGQIKANAMRLFMVYGAAISSSARSHALPADRRAQIRQTSTRPGSPHGVDLYDGLKISLISMDRPCARTSAWHADRRSRWRGVTACEAELSYRIEPGEPYFHDLRERWSAALRAAHIGIPRPPYGTAR